MARGGQDGEGSRQLPARLERGGLNRGRLSGRLADEHPHEPPAVELSLAGRRRLLAGVPGRRLGGQRIDVGEDRFREHVQRLRFQSGRTPEGDKAPPRDAGTGPVGAQQRVETSAGAHLALTERPVHIRAPDRSAGFDLGEEVVKRLLDAGADPSAELPLERTRVCGDPADRVDHLVRDVRQRGSEDVNDARWQLVPRLIGH